MGGWFGIIISDIIAQLFEFRENYFNENYYGTPSEYFISI